MDTAVEPPRQRGIRNGAAHERHHGRQQRLRAAGGECFEIIIALVTCLYVSGVVDGSCYVANTDAERTSGREEQAIPWPYNCDRRFMNSIISFVYV